MKPGSPFNFFVTPPHECVYFADREATTLFADPRMSLNGDIYRLLMEHGFRRSGEHIYGPRCESCQACVSLRIPVRDFKANRSQRRNLKHNQDLQLRISQASYSDEQYALYERYVKGRHPNGGMDDCSPEKYVEFLVSSWADTRFLEFRLDGRLVAVAVVDFVTNGMSAVYTFYEPEMEPRGLGSYAILRQIAECRRVGMDYLYLGYWIAESPKMAYKTRFQPYEIYQDKRWQRVER